MDSHYTNLPARNFWKTGVAQQTPATISDLYRKKFDITPDMAIATAGSCFAQHIARHLRRVKANVIDVEPAPEGLPTEIAERYGYRLFTARYANIYIARQLLQLLQEAEGIRQPKHWIWTRGKILVDGLRPTIDPEGFDTKDELIAHRKRHLAAVSRMIRQMNLFIFTLGLTESWIDGADGTVYPTAPHVAAAPPKASRLAFHNMRFAEILADMEAVRALIHTVNPTCRFLLSVSPVPLTATAEDEHVLSATIHSKSVLRGVAGELAKAYPDVDYFPSYELIASHFSHGDYFADNLRSVTDEGVETAMGMFMRAHGAAFADTGEPPPKAAKARRARKAGAKSVCEDELLEAFAK